MRSHPDRRGELDRYAGAAAHSHAPLRFEASGLGRELIKLGVITIGEILPEYGGSARVSMLFRLPEAPSTMLPCRSIATARRVAAELARDWIKAAGLRT